MYLRLRSLVSTDSVNLEIDSQDQIASDKIDGGAEGIRTPDLLNAIEARSQLRHSPLNLISHAAVQDSRRGMPFQPIVPGVLVLL